DGQPAAIQSMHKLGLFGFALRAGRPEADVRAAGLEALEVGARADLAVEALPRQPDFQVVGPGRGEAHVAGAEQYAAIGQAEEFEDAFGVTRQPLVLGVRVLRAAELD